MATQIKLKRGTTTPTTSDIANGEVAIDTSAKKFYINDNGTIKEIGGGTSSSGDSTSPLSGDVRGYTGDGSTVAYTVTSGADVENVLVFINGVFQRPTTDYTVSGTTLTFGTAPVNGDAITIKELVEGENTFNDNPLVRAYTGDGSTVGYNVTSGKAQEEFLVFINGVFQRPTTDFTVSSGTLTFGTAPANGDVISIKELAESSGALLTIVDDTSTTTTINKGESLKIAGGSNVTTSLTGDTLTINSSASGDLTIADDSSTTTTLDLANDTLKVAGGTNITTSLSGDTLTINGPDLTSYVTLTDTQTLSNKTLDAPTFTGNTTFDTNTLYVDSSNNRVGIGTTSPAYQFEIENTGANALLVLDRTDGAACFIEGQANRSAFGSVGATPLALAYNSAAVVTIGASGAITVNPDGANPFTFPTSDGSSGQVLQTNGSGTLSFATVSGGGSADFSAVDSDITPDTHNSYDIGQLGSAFRDVTFVRKVQKNVEIFTNALGLGTVATNLGFNINSSAANFTQVYTNAGGLDSPVLGGGNATFDDNNPAFLF